MAHRSGIGDYIDEDQDVDAVILEGADAGVSFRSVHDPSHSLTHTMISNTTDTWQIARLLATHA